MARDLYENLDSFREDLDHCFEWVSAFAGFDLKPILFPEESAEVDTQNRLSQTAAAQPALFSIEYSLSRLLKELGIEPDAMLGHSVSEYVAACLSGVFSPEDAMKVICKRGQLVQNVPEGSMLAVKLSEAELRPNIDGHLDLGSTLAADHCVVSGEPEAVSQLEALLKAKAVQAKQVKVTRAYHSKMLDPILDAFGEFVASIELHSPTIPFISGVTGDWITREQAQSVNYWVEQLRSPVRLYEGFKTLNQNLNSVFVEVGCGTLLSSLAKALPELGDGHSYLSVLPSAFQQIDDRSFLNQELQRYSKLGHTLDQDRLNRWLPKVNADTESTEPSATENLSPMETQISRFFYTVLGRESIGKDENFLEAGGNSLMAMQLIGRIREELDVELNLRDFFEHLSIASLSAFLENPNSEAKTLTDNSRLDSPSKCVPSGTNTADMKFSVFFFSGDEGAQPEDRYRSVLDAAQFADQNGFDAIWIPERHFNKFGGLYPNPAVLGAAIAAQTESIYIRGGSVVAPLHHPVRIAEEWSALDNISKGRIGISFGSGFHPKDFLLAPQNFENRKQVMFDSIDIIRTLWHGDRITASSGEGKPSTVQLYPSPFSKELPTWLSTTRSFDTFQEAGEHGHHVLTALLRLSTEELKERITLYREERTKAGLSPESGRITLMLHTFVGPDMEYVQSQVKAPLKDYLRSHMEHTSAVSQEKSGGKEKVLSAEEEEELLEHAYQRYFRESSLIGTVDSCLETVKLLRAIGVDEIACLIDFGVSDEALKVGLEHLAKLQETVKNA